MSVRLGTQSGGTGRADWRRELVAVPAAEPVTDRPRPRWTQAVGASVLLSVLDTLDAQDETASA